MTRLTPWQWNGDHITPSPLRVTGYPSDQPVVWLASRTDEPHVHSRLLALLSPDEHARHGEFRRSEDRQRFLLGRGLLRLLLGAHLDISARHIAFANGRFGKPTLAREHSGARLHFNVSHSGDVVLLAFCAGREVGVDVEQIKPEVEWKEIAALIFTPQQHATWMRQAGEMRAREFFQAWTRREARLKAMGLGLAATGVSSSTAQQEFFDIDLPKGYIGSLTLEESHPAASAECDLVATKKPPVPHRGTGGLKSCD